MNTESDIANFWSNSSIQGANFRARALKRLHIPNKDKRALICPTTTPGSIGDEAMVQALTKKLVDRGFTVDLLVISQEEDWSSIDGIENKIDLPRFSQYLHYIPQLNQYTHFYLIGADCLDGYYDVLTAQWLLWITYCASLVCDNVTIVGFSFNKTPNNSFKKPFSALDLPNVRINNRDPLSFERFRKYSNTKNYLTADVAFMLEPIDAPTKIHNVFGLNISPHSLVDKSLDDIVSHFTYEINKILDLNKSQHILLLPHDFRGEKSDAVILEEIIKKVKSPRVSIAHYNKHPAREIKGLTKQLDYVISGRMHLAIAALGCGTPAICVTYQDKFEGLFQHFGLSSKELAVKPEEIMQDDGLLKIYQYMQAEHPKLRKEIESKLGDVLSLSSDNLR